MKNTESFPLSLFFSSESSYNVLVDMISDMDLELKTVSLA